MKIINSTMLSIVALSLTAAPVFAHTDPGTVQNGFSAGVVHPLFGVDHLLTMLGAGLLSAQIGGRALWAIPTAFLTGMVGGGTVGLSGHQWETVEYAIAASLVAVGVAIASNCKTVFALSILIVAIIGAFHGHAHGSELPSGVRPVFYVTGFLIATSALLLSGVLIGRWILRFKFGSIGLRCSGGVFASVGLILLIPSQ